MLSQFTGNVVPLAVMQMQAAVKSDGATLPWLYVPMITDLVGNNSEKNPQNTN